MEEFLDLLRSRSLDAHALAAQHAAAAGASPE
jgi:hypothetical protein